MKNFKFKLALFLVLAIPCSMVVADTNKAFRTDMTFLDFEDITHFLNHPHKQVVHIINYDDSPIVIEKAEVSDRGTVFFKSLTGAVNTYSIKVLNKTTRRILAYEVTWVLKHPFEDYVFHKIRVNSVDPLGPGDKQTLKFRRDKHYRDDAYYYAEISKVEFDDDESIWEAPELENKKTNTRMDALKEEIEALEGDDDGIDLKKLKDQYDIVKGSDTLNQVIEEEAVNTDTETTTTTTTTEQIVESYTTEVLEQGQELTEKDIQFNKLLEEIDKILEEQGVEIPETKE